MRPLPIGNGLMVNLLNINYKIKMKLCVQNPESAKNSKNSMLPASYRGYTAKNKNIYKK